MEDGRWESPSSLRRYLDAVTAIAGDQTTTLISPTAVWLRGDFYHRYCGGHDPMAHNKFLPATAHPKSELIVSGSFEWRIIVEVAKSFNNGMPTDIVADTEPQIYDGFHDGMPTYTDNAVCIRFGF